MSHVLCPRQIMLFVIFCAYFCFCIDICSRSHFRLASYILLFDFSFLRPTILSRTGRRGELRHSAACFAPLYPFYFGTGLHLPIHFSYSYIE